MSKCTAERAVDALSASHPRNHCIRDHQRTSHLVKEGSQKSVQGSVVIAKDAKDGMDAVTMEWTWNGHAFDCCMHMCLSKGFSFLLRHTTRTMAPFCANTSSYHDHFPCMQPYVYMYVFMRTQ